MSRIRIEFEVGEKFCEGEIECPLLRENETCFFVDWVGDYIRVDTESGKHIRCQACKDAEAKE